MDGLFLDASALFEQSLMGALGKGSHFQAKNKALVRLQYTVSIFAMMHLQTYTLHTPAKFCSTNLRCSRTVLEHLELF